MAQGIVEARVCLPWIVNIPWTSPGQSAHLRDLRDGPDVSRCFQGPWHPMAQELNTPKKMIHNKYRIHNKYTYFEEKKNITNFKQICRVGATHLVTISHPSHHHRKFSFQPPPAPPSPGSLWFLWFDLWAWKWRICQPFIHRMG